MTRTLRELALKYCDDFPLVKQILLDDFCVDNCFTGSNSLETAIKTRNDLIKVLKHAGYECRKWCSNEKQLLSGIDPENIESHFPLSFDQKPTIKTLGILET